MGRLRIVDGVTGAVTTLGIDVEVPILEVEGGALSAIVLVAPNGSKWKLTVDNGGVISTIEVT
jgi:hypothetical protein